MTAEITVRGIDSAEHLRDWFAAKGQAYLVFKLADVLDLTEDNQRLFLDLVDWIGSAPSLVDAINLPTRDQVQRAGHRGYALIPIPEMCKLLELDDLQAVQALVFAYRQARQDKMEPSHVEPCDCKGRISSC